MPDHAAFHDSLARYFPKGGIRRIRPNGSWTPDGRRRNKNSKKVKGGGLRVAPTERQWRVIHEMAMSGCSLTSIAQHVGCSPGTLSKLVRNVQGMGVKEWKAACVEYGKSNLRHVIFRAAMRAGDDAAFIPAVKLAGTMLKLPLRESRDINVNHSGEIKVGVAELPSNGMELPEELDVTRQLEHQDQDSAFFTALDAESSEEYAANGYDRE